MPELYGRYGISHGHSRIRRSDVEATVAFRCPRHREWGVDISVATDYLMSRFDLIGVQPRHRVHSIEDGPFWEAINWAMVDIDP